MAFTNRRWSRIALVIFFVFATSSYLLLLRFEVLETPQKRILVQENVTTETTEQTEKHQTHDSLPFLVPVDRNSVSVIEDITEVLQAGLDSSYIPLVLSQNVSYCSDELCNPSLCYYSIPKALYCRSTDLMIDLNQVEVLETFDNKPLPHRELGFKLGAFDIDNCENRTDVMDELKWEGIIFEKSNLDVFTTFVPQAPRISASKCEGRWNDQLAYLVTRYEYVNVYHTTLDLFVMWFTAQLYGIPHLNQFQVVFLDAKVPGSLDHLWETFTESEPIRITDLKDEGDEIICYRDSFFSCPSSNSRWFHFLKRPIFMADQMEGSLLWKSFRDFARQKFDILHLDSFVTNSNPTITLLLRKDYEKTGRSSFTRRKFHDDAQVIALLDTFTDVNIYVVEFSEMSWEEQVALMAQTDLLIGVHGAGLTQLIYLPNNSFVFEISSQGHYSRIHFRLFSVWLEHSYFNWPYADIDMEDPNEDVYIYEPEKLLIDLKYAVNEARIAKCAQEKANCEKLYLPPLWNPPLVR